MSNQQMRAPLWVHGDWNALFGLGTNSILNLLVMTGLLLFAVQLPAELVFGRILPAVGIMLCATNLCFAYMAKKLAERTGRMDVTALPSGTSVPHMFIVCLVVMLPVKAVTGDPLLAWRAGMAWVFIVGLVCIIGSFFAPLIRRITPRAALLGALAGTSLAFITMKPSMEILSSPIIGFVCFAIVFTGFFASFRFPGNLPAGLVAIVVGSAIGWLTGSMSIANLSASFANFGLHLPSLAIGDLFKGFDQIAPLLVTAIPFGIYDFIEAMDNVESAATTGDEYNERSVILCVGAICIAGTMLGSPFANAVYIGHPGWKQAGGRIGYSIATGIVVLILTWLGLMNVLFALIPMAAIQPILIYIGALICALAFQETPKRHAPAVVLAMIPAFASWAGGLVNNTLQTAGKFPPSPEMVGSLAQNGVLFEGLVHLGGGAILAGLIWGAITTFIIDKQFNKAAGFALFGTVVSFTGFIHGEAVGLNQSPMISLGYIFLAATLALFQVVENKRMMKESDTTGSLEI